MSFPAHDEEEQDSWGFYHVAASEMLVACGTLRSIRSIEVYAFSLFPSGSLAALVKPTVLPPWSPWLPSVLQTTAISQ